MLHVSWKASDVLQRANGVGNDSGVRTVGQCSWEVEEVA